MPSRTAALAPAARRDAANGRPARRGDPTYVHAKDAGVKSKGGLPCNASPYDEDDDE